MVHTTEDYQEHVDKIAGELGCLVAQRPGMAGMMYVEYEPPMIEGPVLGSKFSIEADYYVMLHELGHVFHGHTQGRPPYNEKKFYFENGVLRSEAEAWEYAIDTSLLGPEGFSAETGRFMWERCMGTYYQGAVWAGGRGNQRLGNGHRHHVAFTYDEPDAYFWSIKERMLRGT